ncbi:MAG: lipoyl synthase [candidate division WOR-3 bacterium]
MNTPPLPKWIKKALKRKKLAESLKEALYSRNLYTVCEEARCPNIGECFSQKVATFLIMGNICTRNCKFCAINKGIPKEIDETEPIRIAKEIKKLNLNYVVITSPTRDDLEDGGAGFFEKTVKAIKKLNKGIKVEVLIPDFKGNLDSLKKVLSSNIDVLGHNIETVPRLYPKVRLGAIYERSLKILEEASQNSRLLTKSGFMVGLGEEKREVIELLKELKRVGCKIVTIGQYFPPSLKHLPVKRYLSYEEFKELERIAFEIGFDYVASGPLVRSSYKSATIFYFVKGKTKS